MSPLVPIILAIWGAILLLLVAVLTDKTDKKPPTKGEGGAY